MQASIARTLLMAAGAIAIVAASFFATLQIMNYLAQPPDPNADVIHVAEATYGMSCNGSKTPSGTIAEIKAGNATDAVSKQCDGAKGKCEFTITLPDPANGCGKDFAVTWRCGAGETGGRVYVSGEAQGKKALLVCPASE